MTMTKENMQDMKRCSVVVEKAIIDKSLNEKNITGNHIHKGDSLPIHSNKNDTAKNKTDKNNNTNEVNEEKSLFPSIEIPSSVLPWNKKLENATGEPTVKKFKRKRGNLDQLLPQAEAKRRREENLNTDLSAPFSAFRSIMSKKHVFRPTLSTNNTKPSYSNENYTSARMLSKLNQSLNKFDDSKKSQTTPESLTKLTTTSPETFHTVSSHTNHRIPQTYTSKEKIIEAESIQLDLLKLDPKIGNKRTITANERYSKLTNSQLQRRLVANARERSRVHALSNAFNSLRVAIPSYSTEQKLSKLTILRVAINYINALHNVLQQDEQAGTSATIEFTRCVEECSSVLQTEYGRSKSKHGLE